MERGAERRGVVESGSQPRLPTTHQRYAAGCSKRPAVSILGDDCQAGCGPFGYGGARIA